MRYKLAYEDWANGRVVTYPDITFDGRLRLFAGDLTFDRIYFGRAHTGSDILIHIPELKILMTGDLFYYGYRPSFVTVHRFRVPRSQLIFRRRYLDAWSDPAKYIGLYINWDSCYSSEL